jgi:hypothetical protein
MNLVVAMASLILRGRQRPSPAPTRGIGEWRRQEVDARMKIFWYGHPRYRIETGSRAIHTTL